MPQCNQSQTGTHEYVPHPSILRRVTCLSCHHTKLCTKAKCETKYLKYRRTMVRTHNLLNVTVPLDGPSSRMLVEVLDKCEIRRGGGGGGAATATATKGGESTVTLLEGIWPHPIANADGEAQPQQPSHHLIVETLRQTLQTHPTITFRKLHKVRRSDRSNTDLLLADVVLHPNVEGAVQSASDGPSCVLPQYPAQISLGTVSREGRTSVNALKVVRSLLQGKTLNVDPERIGCAGNVTNSNDRGGIVGGSHTKRGNNNKGGIAVVGVDNCRRNGGPTVLGSGGRQMPRGHHWNATKPLSPSARDYLTADDSFTDATTMSSSESSSDGGDGSSSGGQGDRATTASAVVATVDDVYESDVLHIDLTFLDNFNEHCAEAPMPPPPSPPSPPSRPVSLQRLPSAVW